MWVASWFEIGSNTTFSPIEKLNSFFINIDKYVISLSCLHIKLNPESGCLSFTNDESVLKALQERLLRLTRESP